MLTLCRFECLLRTTSRRMRRATARGEESTMANKRSPSFTIAELLLAVVTMTKTCCRTWSWLAFVALADGELAPDLNSEFLMEAGHG